MNVLLIQPHSGFQLRGISYPVCRDLMMTATFLKHHGFSVCVWNRCISIQNEMVGFKADAAILFVAQSSSIKDAVTVSDSFRAQHIPVIWADMVSYFAAPLSDSYLHADYVLIKEYCFAAEELLNTIKNAGDIHTIKGLAYFENNEVKFNEPRPLSDFSYSYPVDWSLIEVDKCFRRFQDCKRMLYLNASVGCPFHCAFCTTPLCYGSRRKRPISHVLQEIDYLVKNHHLDGINFSDELLLFTDDELEALRVCREENDRAFVWGGETRPQLLNPVLLKKMYDAGCRWLLFGLESGSEQTRERLNKQYDSLQVRSIVDECTRIGIATFGSFIIGSPKENQKDLYDTVQFALSINLDAYLFNYFGFVSGTPLYQEAEASGRFSYHNIMDFEKLVIADNLYVNLSMVPKKELATVKAFFDFLSITRKKTHNGKAAGRQFIRKAIDSILGYLRGSRGKVFSGLWNIAKRGFPVIWNLVAHPFIRKKYGLYKKAMDR